MRIVVLSFLLVAALTTPALAKPVKPGEKITYKVSQMGLKAGEATLTFVGDTTYKDQKAVLIVFRADGFNFFDEEKIYLNPENYKPMAVERDINIFGKKEKIQEIYSRNQVRVIKEGSPEQTIDKAGWMDNIYAFIYGYRQKGKFQKTDRFNINLPTTEITIKMVKETKIAAAGRDYDAYYLESEPSKYKLWFDQSENKLPLRISGAIGMANTVMIMTKYEE